MSVHTVCDIYILSVNKLHFVYRVFCSDLHFTLLAKSCGFFFKSQTIFLFRV